MGVPAGMYPTEKQGLFMQATYHKVRTSRKLLAGMQLFQRNFTDHVIICAWIPHTPAHVHHLELVTLFMTEISQFWVDFAHQCITLDSCICTRSVQKTFKNCNKCNCKYFLF